jgi:predicted AAA+ superfamily ATPase
MTLHFDRVLNLVSEAERRSVFLFGPRQTGKTSVLRKQFPGAKTYSLLKADEFLKISMDPAVIRGEIEAAIDNARSNPVIIDEIQKLPVLLDEVHYMIESLGVNFILTGSSPRKLKRGGANLLGGRARTRHLFPLVSHEIPDFDLLRACNVGTLPSIYLSDEPTEDLKSYCGNYLQEEIQAEGLVRKIENFSRFLQTASLVNGELVNMESLSSDSGIPSNTLREYFSILEDTLVGRMLKPLGRSVHRKSVSAAKFYLFDLGVTNTLARRGEILPKSELFGKALEHLIHNELVAWLSYRRDDRPLTFWRDRYGNEVDFLLGDDYAIEVKASSMVSGKHLKGLRMLSQDMLFKQKIVVSMDSSPRRIDDILVLPCVEFLQRLWSGQFD